MSNDRAGNLTADIASGKIDKYSFKVFIAGLSMILFSIGLIACILLWKYAQIYEATVPDYYMSKFMSSQTWEDWEDFLFNNIDGDLSEFEKDSELFRELYDTYLKNTELSWRLNTAESTSESSVFIVSAGNVDLCKVTLVPPEGENLAFGRHTWVLGDMSPCSFTDSLKNITVEIAAPYGKDVIVNGVGLSKDYLVGEIEAPNITDLERRIGTEAKFQLYRIENVYGALEISDTAGNVFSCVRDTDTYRYTIPSDDTYSFTVEAPEGVKVYVCGTELTSEDASGEGENIFEGFDRYTDGKGWKTLIYSQSGLYTQPVITAVGPDGVELNPFESASGKLYFFLPEDSDNTKSKSNYVRSFFIRYANYATKAFRTDVTEPYEYLMASILPGTELFRYVGYSTDAMSWASYTNIKYDEISYEDIHTVGKKAFICTIRFSADITAHTWEGENKYTEKAGYEMLFVRYNSGWYAAAMIALE